MSTVDEDWQSLRLMCLGSILAEYVALLQAFPPKPLQARRADAGEAVAGTVAEVELLSSLSDVVEINREARRCVVMDPQGGDFEWPDQLLVIGESGTGDYYCCDVSGDNPGVLQYLHQSNEFEVIADSLDEYVRLLLKAFAPRSRKRRS